MDPLFARNSLGTRAGTTLYHRFRRLKDSQRQALVTKVCRLEFRDYINMLNKQEPEKYQWLTEKIENFHQLERHHLPIISVIFESRQNKKQRQKFSRKQIIQSETQNLRKRIQKSKHQQQVLNKLSLRKDQLVGEVKQLLDTVINYNIALEKLRINTPEEIDRSRLLIKRKNAKLQIQLDDIFIRRTQLQQQISSTQEQQQNIHNFFELRLKQLDSSQRDEYYQLMKEKQALFLEESQKQKDLEQLLIKLTNASNRLKIDIRKLKSYQIKQQIQSLQERKSQYESQLNQKRLTFPEARNKILIKMKQDHEKIVSMEKRLKEVQKNVNIYEKILHELEISLEDGKISEQEKRKHEILYTKQKEIDAFLNSFEKVREQELTKLSKLENQIVEILEKNSKILHQLRWKQDPFKKGIQVKSTPAKAKAQLKNKLNNLRMLGDAQKRVDQEVSELRRKINQMNSTISTKFNKTEQIQAELSKNLSQLTIQEQELEKLKDELEENENSSSYELYSAEKRYELQQNFRSYAEVQKELENNSRQLYYVQHCVRRRSKQMRYQDVRDECVGLGEEWNRILLDR